MYDFGLCTDTWQRNVGKLREESCGLVQFLPYQHTGTSETYFRHSRMWCVFSKATFIKPLCENGLHVISRFRNDAVLFYPILENRTGKRGRPKLYDRKIDFENLTSQDVLGTKWTRVNFTDWKHTPKHSNALWAWLYGILWMEERTNGSCIFLRTKYRTHRMFWTFTGHVSNLNSAFVIPSNMPE